MDKIKVFSSHYIAPYVRYPKQTGGICDKNMRMILESVRGHGSWEGESMYETPLKPVRTEDKSAVFLGHITNHYGHFLWETLSRFWVFMKLDKVFFADKDLVFIDHSVGKCNIGDHHILNYVMCALGIRHHSFKKITTITGYEKIYLPEAMNSIMFPMVRNNSYIGQAKYTGLPLGRGSITNADYQRSLFYSIAKVIVPMANRELKVYITREKSHDKRPTSIYDGMFAKLGFVILNPSSNSFIRDLKYYKSARVIAGIDGTGLHNVGFMQHPNRRMIELKHRPEKFLEGNGGLAGAQYFFNWFNEVPYAVIPCFKLSFAEVERAVRRVLVTLGT